MELEKDRVTMRRSGSFDTQLIIEKGSRHQCLYDTGFGAITVGINGRDVRSTLNDDGGEVDFSYAMDINTALTSENRVIIKVDPQNDTEEINTKS
ncbi:MAG: DUF1934 domain-containing protein [Oscillospiraceae bacterium]|nr:DUF1934 domain-containing protein [Oscillospiraceae bacterium]